MKVHEFDGDKYKEASRHQKEWGDAIISEFNLKGIESVLDLGCGDGVLTKEIAELVPNGNVTGIDASEGMIATASQMISGNLSFQRMNIDDIAFSNEFDLIFSNAALHWVKDHKKLLENCHKALKQGGFIRFNFAGNGNCSNFYAVIKKIMKDERYESFFSSFEWPWYMPAINEYKEEIDLCNFKDIRIWEENADRHFADAHEMIKWIEQPSIVPFLKLIDDEYKEDFKNEVINEMIEKTEQEDGRCFETFRRINVYAVK